MEEKERREALKKILGALIKSPFIDINDYLTEEEQMDGYSINMLSRETMEEEARDKDKQKLEEIIKNVSTLEEAADMIFKVGITMDRYSLLKIFPLKEADTEFAKAFSENHGEKLVPEYYTRRYEMIECVGDYMSTAGISIEDLPPIVLDDSNFLFGYLLGEKSHYHNGRRLEVSTSGNERYQKVVKFVKDLQLEYDKRNDSSKAISPTDIERATSGVRLGEFRDTTEEIKKDAKDSQKDQNADMDFNE